MNWRLNAGGWLLLDGAMAMFAMYLAYLFSPYSIVLHTREAVPHLNWLQASCWFAASVAVTSHIFGLQSPLFPRQFWPMVIRCLGSTVLAVIALEVIVFAIFYHHIGRYILLQASIYQPLGMIAARSMLWRRSGERRQRVLLVGAPTIQKQVKALIDQSGLPLDVLTFVDQTLDIAVQNSNDDDPLLRRSSLKQQCERLQIDEVVTCIGGKISEESMKQLMECLGMGVRVSDFSNFVERNVFQVPVENIRGEWFLQADLELAHPVYLLAKRAVDILVSLAGLVLSAPCIGLAAIAIRLESNGPVFYSQTRVGLHNQSFTIWKLRSMRQNAESDGPRWAAAADARITRVGKILRLTRLDEVPQFWNILRGEMSLVGPRPERPEFIEKLTMEIPYYQQRHLVKPGLTGWAQINHPYGASTDDALCKLRYDLYYLKYASIGLDIQIALRTIGVAMKGSR